MESFVNYGSSNRGLMHQHRTTAQVEHRYTLMQELHKEISNFKAIIAKHELSISQAQDEIIKKQEILDSLSRGENIPGETY